MSDENYEFLDQIDFDAIEESNNEKLAERDAEAIVDDNSECESCKI